MRNSWTVARLVRANAGLIRQIKLQQELMESTQMAPTEFAIIRLQRKAGDHIRKLTRAFQNQPDRYRQAELVITALSLCEQLKHLWRALEKFDDFELRVAKLSLGLNISSLSEFCREMLRAADDSFKHAFRSLEYIP